MSDWPWDDPPVNEHLVEPYAGYREEDWTEEETPMPVNENTRRGLRQKAVADLLTDLLKGKAGHTETVVLIDQLYAVDVIDEIDERAAVEEAEFAAMDQDEVSERTEMPAPRAPRKRAGA